jgi:hypothetical protein
MGVKPNQLHVPFLEIGHRMLRLGSIVISAWAVLNLIPSLAILANTIFFDGNSPAIYQILDDEQVQTLSKEIRTSINSVAVYANGLNVALCLLALVVVWLGLNRRVRWAFWGLLVAFATALLAGTAGDYVLGTVHPEINIISGIILAFGFVFSARGLFWDSTQSAAPASSSHP